MQERTPLALRCIQLSVSSQVLRHLDNGGTQQLFFLAHTKCSFSLSWYKTTEWESNRLVSEYECGGKQRNLYKMQQAPERRHALCHSGGGCFSLFTGKMMNKETTCVNQFEWNPHSTEIKCKTCNPEQAQDSSLCLKKWHISNTAAIKERTVGCFSRNAKKLKLRWPY